MVDKTEKYILSVLLFSYILRLNCEEYDSNEITTIKT